MPERDIRERDILVASNEFAYVQDLTKGDIVLYVGPTKISLSNRDPGGRIFDCPRVR
jgi:major vault protein